MFYTALIACMILYAGFGLYFLYRRSLQLKKYASITDDDEAMEYILAHSIRHYNHQELSKEEKTDKIELLLKTSTFEYKGFCFAKYLAIALYLFAMVLQLFSHRGFSLFLGFTNVLFLVTCIYVVAVIFVLAGLEKKEIALLKDLLAKGS